MEFILASQARVQAMAEKHAEQIAQHAERIAKLEASLATVTDLVGRVAQAEITQVERMTVGFQELRELQANTEYKLNALIDTVDKLVRRNGHKE